MQLLEYTYSMMRMFFISKLKDILLIFEGITSVLRWYIVNIIMKKIKEWNSWEENQIE